MVGRRSERGRGQRAFAGRVFMTVNTSLPMNETGTETETGNSHGSSHGFGGARDRLAWVGIRMDRQVRPAVAL